MTFLPERVIVLDLETTGEDYRLDRILEIGAIRLEGDREVESFHAWVEPGVELRAENIAIHGITPDMLVGAESLSGALARFRDFVGDWPWVAHNAPFDQRFLSHHGQTCGIAFVNPVFDSLALAREAYPAEKALSLARLAERLGVGPRPSHRALEDARSLAAVYPFLRIAVEERRAVHRSRFSEIENVAIQYREMGQEIEKKQLEWKDLRRTLELFFEETGSDAIPVDDRDVIRSVARMRYTFHAEETRVILDRLGLLEPCTRLDRERVDRLLDGDRLPPAEREALRAARREAGLQRTLQWESRPVAKGGEGADTRDLNS